MNPNFIKNITEFPAVLKQLRLIENLTQKEVASKLSIATQSYQAYEKGISLPTLTNFLKLCEIFDVTPNDLLDINNWGF